MKTKVKVQIKCFGPKYILDNFDCNEPLGVMAQTDIRVTLNDSVYDNLGKVEKLVKNIVEKYIDDPDIEVNDVTPDGYSC